MSSFLISATGKTLDLQVHFADKLNEIANTNLIEELAKALADDQPKLSTMLQALLPDLEFQALKDFLEHTAQSLKPSEQLRQLAGPVADIPAKGIAWTCKSAREGKLPDTGIVTLTLKGSGQTTVKILPGPSYDFRGALGIAGGLKTPFSFGRVSVSGQRSGQGPPAREILPHRSHPRP